MNIAYVRVSSIEQNESRQLEALQVHKIDKWFSEKVSAKDDNRPQLKAMIEFAREGDTIFIHDLSRIARNIKDLLNIVETMKSKGINLVSNKERIETSSPSGKLMVVMLAAFNDFERESILERQREGISIAKREGKYEGRKKIVIKEFEKYYLRYKNRELTKAQLCRELKISRPTLNKIIAENNNKQIS